MQKKWAVVLNVAILIAVAFFLTLFGLKFFVVSKDAVNVECVEVNKVASFIYESCYDAYAKTIFVNVKRTRDTYNLKSFEFSFFDIDQQVYEIDDVPNVGESKAYKISAEKNPEDLYIRMNIVKDFSSEICEEPRIIFVKYCPPRTPEEEISGDISPFKDISLNSFVEISNFDYEDSDLFSMSLVDKEAVWKSECSSNWTCGDWESCENGVQKRSCEDIEECVIPTDSPDTVRYCDNRCKEKWECTWGECINGFTEPDCKDINNCGTAFEFPEKISCVEKKASKCSPNIVCSDWSSCEINYNFLDLIGGAINDLTGSKSRLCVDKNKCSDSKEEIVACSVNIDVYTKRFLKCGKEYIGIYNKLNNNLIARVEAGNKENLNPNFLFDNNADSEYCDYCFNNKMDGDEKGIDCGGGCMNCEEKYGEMDYKKNSDNWFNKIFSW